MRREALVALSQDGEAAAHVDLDGLDRDAHGGRDFGVAHLALPAQRERQATALRHPVQHPLHGRLQLGRFEAPLTLVLVERGRASGRPLPPPPLDELMAEMADREIAHGGVQIALDRKSTRLNSSHPSISYAVFCL